MYPGRGEPARRHLLDLLLARVAVRGATFGHDPVIVRAGAVPAETDYVAVLTDAGFSFVKRYARMTRSLAGVPPTPPTPPEGVLVRRVDPDSGAEMRRFHALVEEAFVDSLDHDPIDYDAWRARLAKLPSIPYGEWFVAEVDGRWAGALQSTDQGIEQNEGWVKMLAVLRPYRRRGVGRALLEHAFAAYAAKGLTDAGLGVDLTNPTSPASLYRSVGLTRCLRGRHVRAHVARGGRLRRGGAGGARAQLGDVVVGRAGLLGGVGDLRQVPGGRQAALVAVEDVHPGAELALERGRPAR